MKKNLSSDEINKLPAEKRRQAISEQHQRINNIVTNIQAKKYTPHSGQHCFVATACYGESEMLTLLRNWRDQQESGLGKRFVDFYYSGFGKRSALVLRKFPALKIPARLCINIFARFFI